MLTRIVCCAAGCLVFAPAALAQDGAFAGAKVSTLGLGGEVGYSFSDHLSVRVSATAFQYETSETLDDIDSDLELDLGAIGGQVDYHPWGNAFFVSAGAYSNLNEVNTSAQPSEPVEIGGTVYTPAEIGRITGNGSFDDFAPYAGLGGAWEFGGGNWEFVAEAGAYFQGAPHINYTATGFAADDPDFQDDLEAEARKAEQDLDRLSTYPVLSLGLRYRF